jgi:hypothetical protein
MDKSKCCTTSSKQSENLTLDALLRLYELAQKVDMPTMIDVSGDLMDEVRNRCTVNDDMRPTLHGIPLFVHADWGKNTWRIAYRSGRQICGVGAVETVVDVGAPAAGHFFA